MLILLTLMITLLPKVCIAIENEGIACTARCSCSPSDEDVTSLAVKCKYLHLSYIPQVLRLDSVQLLDLSNNQITTIGNDSFLNYARLSTIILSYNELEDIQLSAFAGLSMMRSIDLSYNNLKSIHPEIFSSNPVLESVSLKSNPLAYLSSDSPILVSASASALDLSSCSLTSVHAVTFSRLPSLYTLDLSSNLLQTISVGILEKLPKLAKVELSNNRWTCSCDLVEVMQWTRERRVQQPAHKPVKCFQRGQYKTLWSVAGVRRSCNESRAPAPLVAREVVIHPAANLPSTVTTRLPLPLKNEQPLSLLVEVRDENEPIAATERETGGLDTLFSWDTNTMLVFIILPCTLGIAVVASLIAVNYFTKRMKGHRVQHEIQGKENQIAALLSDVPLLDPHLSTGFTNKQSGYMCRNSQHIRCDECHIYEQID